MVLAVATFLEVMASIGSLGVILLAFGTIVVFALRQSSNASRKAFESYHETIELNEKWLVVAHEHSRLQAEGNRLMAELIDALRSFNQRIDDRQESSD